MTLSVAAVAVVVSLIIGLTVGLIAGFYGKWLDNVLMRFGEIISAFPFLPLAMTLSSIVHNASSINERERVFMIMFILGILSWPGLARLVRGQILAEREKDYILAAKALGVKERSEERRVGKECRGRWSRCQKKEKTERGRYNEVQK